MTTTAYGGIICTITHRRRWTEVKEMIVAYPELIGEMAKRKLTRTSIAESIGISTRTLYSKLMGTTDFTLSEANKIHATFFPDIEKDRLFARTDQQDSA